jgi:lipid II:glycine glycyltransferase (peptidoglycan interpeptide bridge formation enzyme)
MTSTPATPDPTREQAAWDRCVTNRPVGHLLQTWAWGELKARFGWHVERLAHGDACLQVLFRPLPAGLGTIAYAPKGPAGNLDDPSLRALLDAIRPVARRHRAICLKIEPDLEDGPATARQLRALGFRPGLHTIQPRRTLLVDLGAEPDVILQRMKSKTRYNVRLAGRKGITVRPGDEADLPAFYRLMETTAERDRFAIHSQAYYEAAHRLFVPCGQGRLLLAEYKGQLLAGLVVLIPGPGSGGTACYMYGASSNEHRNLMPTYLLQWEAMRWARSIGCRTYDLWGIPDEDEETLEDQFTERSDGLWGVYRFKRGFGGDLDRAIGAWDRVCIPWRYQLVRWALILLRRIRGSEG